MQASHPSIVPIAPVPVELDGLATLLEQHQQLRGQALRFEHIAEGGCPVDDEELYELLRFFSCAVCWHCNDELTLLVPRLLRHADERERACILAPRDDHLRLDQVVQLCGRDLASLIETGERPGGMASRAAGLSWVVGCHLRRDEERLYSLARRCLSSAERHQLGEVLERLAAARESDSLEPEDVRLDAFPG